MFNTPKCSLSSLSVGSAPIPHRVLIASEEQFKTFLLPTLKPSGKYKLTAHEGARIRRIGFTTFHSKVDSTYSENCMLCLTNQVRTNKTLSHLYLDLFVDHLSSRVMSLSTPCQSCASKSRRTA